MPRNPQDRPTAAPPETGPPAPRDWPGWLGLGLLGAYALLPRRLRFVLSGAIGGLAWLLEGRRRRYVGTNLALCFPQATPAWRARLNRRYFRYYLRILLDLPLAWWGSDRRLDRRVELVGRDHLDRALASGRRVILLTGHLIGLDFGVLGLSRHYPMVSVYKPFRNRLVDRLMYRARTRYGLHLLAREAGLRPVVRAVREGAVLYYIPDEDLGPAQSVFAPFFGIPKASLSTLGRLARTCEADVIPCATCYDPASDRYRVHLGAPMRGFPQGEAQADTAAMNRELERLVRLCPAQYMWGLRLFRTRPPGMAPLY